MPKDPNALMQLAARVNGLGSPGMKPWHLKANYQTYDADGKPKDQGVFEEWWAAPDKYKISYTSPSFNQVQYHINGNFLISGDRREPGLLSRMIENFYVHPLPPTGDAKRDNYAASEKTDGPISMVCLHSTSRAPGLSVVTYCFAKDLPAVRIEAPYGDVLAFFNGIVRANGHYVAKRVRVQRGPTPLLNVDLTALEDLLAMDDADFTAPPNANFAAPARVVAANLMAKYKKSGAEPTYPPIARAAHIRGTVVLQTSISETGAVDDLLIISGPPMLQRAAYDAVKTWRFDPYLLNGKPVNVETQFYVVFTF